uniref:Uncharacterized protein n=1 Tax=Meloidogyne hapla TaxID=6305 RepID=A0A1I8BR31_MELHA
MAATTKKKTPLLAQIRRLKREEVAKKYNINEFNGAGIVTQMGGSDYNTEPEEEYEDKCYDSSATVEDDDFDLSRQSRPQQRLNRVFSGESDLVRLRDVQNDFSPPPFNQTSLSSFSAVKAATALAGVNLSLTRGFENSPNSSSNNNKNRNCTNKKSASFSSTPSSSSGIASLFSLGNRFSTSRQNSDSSLLRRNSQKGDDQQQNSLCSRRSFKWKNLWGRKNSVVGASVDDTIVVGSNVLKGGNPSTPSGSLFSTKRASSQLLDTLIEDTETFSISGGSREEDLKQKRRLKRHSALLLIDGKEEDKEKEEVKSLNQSNSASTPIRFRTAVPTTTGTGERNNERKEEKTECQEILSTTIQQQRPFSIIGTGHDGEASLIGTSKIKMLSVEEEENNEQQLQPNEQLARYRIEEDSLERFDNFLHNYRRKQVKTSKKIMENNFGMEEEEENVGKEEELEEKEMKRIFKNSRSRKGMKLSNREEENLGRDKEDLQRPATASTLIKKPNHKQEERTAPPLPPRLSRATRRSTNCSPILFISTCQTLDRRQSKKLALHRAVSSRANAALATNFSSTSSPFSCTATLTLPRKRPTPRGVSSQQRRRGNIGSAAARRKSIVQLAMEDSVELAAIVAAVEEQQQEIEVQEVHQDKEGREEVKDVQRDDKLKEDESKQLECQESQKQQQKEAQKQTKQQAMFRVKSTKHLNNNNSNNNTNGHSTKCAILRHLLGATDRSRVCGGKVAPKNIDNNNLGNATISGSSVAELAIVDNSAANRTISKDNKKRETKTNSMILGTIWSIRPRRKKESNAQRSLVNLWAAQSPTENITSIAAVPATKCSPNGNGGCFFLIESRHPH